MTVVAIIVAAGRGSRAGAGIPKQYRPLAGRPLLAHTLEPFLASDRIDGVVCAIHPDDRDLYDAAIAGLAESEKLHPPVAGGAMRQQSVAQALATLDATGASALCLVHDAARPFSGPELIARAIDAAREFGAAVPGTAVTDTVNRVEADGRIVESLQRDTLRAVQTPQAFRLDLLAAAHDRASGVGRHDFTDDGQLMRWAGSPVHVFAGDPANVKLTHAADFEEAERRLRRAGGNPGSAMITRVGTGFDVHAFGDGDHVWLGGVTIPHHRGVLAHSDGDVVLHALTDALLGAIGDGDIGTHFPPSDPQWRGASSDRFLDYAADKVRAAGGIVDHLDVTVLCEAPRIGPHRDAIRARIAAIVRVPLSAVSIKATTTERMGFTGREEGLAAQAAATIRLPESP